MSQVRFETEFKNKPAEVVSGWDAPLSYYHLTIFDTDPAAPEEVFWSGLDVLGFTNDIDTIRNTLEKTLNINPPMGFYDLILRHEGNVIYYWDFTKGEWVR